MRNLNHYHEETSDTYKMRHVLLKVNKKEEEGRIAFLKNINVIKDKERLWKYSKLKEVKEPWQLNVVIDLRLLNWRRRNVVRGGRKEEKHRK